MSWPEVCAEARRIETCLENKLHLYSRLIFSDEENPLISPEQQEVELATELESFLAQLEKCVQKMEAIVSHSSRVANAALLQRYQGVLYDCTTEFKKTQTALGRKRDSAELFRLSSGDDARSHPHPPTSPSPIDETPINPRRGTPGAGGGGSASDHLLRERGALSSSQKGAEAVIGQALAARESLRGQRQLFVGIRTKVADISTSFPSINRAIDAIRKKKIRDNAVLGGVIAFCICFALWWLFSP